MTEWQKWIAKQLDDFMFDEKCYTIISFLARAKVKANEVWDFKPFVLVEDLQEIAEKMMRELKEVNHDRQSDTND